MGITSTQASGYIQATQSQQTAKKTSGSGTKKTTATKQTAAAATDYTVSDVAQSMKVNGDGANTKEVFDYIAENAASNDDFYNIAKNIGYSDYDIMIYLELRYGGTDNWQTIPS
jgi:hypothetical protein